VAGERLSRRGALLLAVVIAAGLWLGARLSNGHADGAGSAADAADAATLDAGASAGVVALRARTLDGAVAPLNAVTTPTVVMIASETCTFCKAALREMGRVAAGRPLRGLRYVTLEGAAAGLPMLRAASVTGATLAGPPTPAAEALFTFQIRGTPTFVALDATGHVTATMVGYLGADELRPWIGVMLGERAEP